VLNANGRDSDLFGALHLGQILNNCIDVLRGPDLILPLFFPPLLFWDAWRTPRDALLKHGLAIAQRSFGLVLFSVFGMAWVIHLLIPGMSATFAIAAVLSPTDAVAIAAIRRRRTL
jgi:NhaP-type Na+/H+ or K+/H+ antiporter